MFYIFIALRFTMQLWASAARNLKVCGATKQRTEDSRVVPVPAAKRSSDLQVAEVTWFTEQHLASPTICSRYAATRSTKSSVILLRTNSPTKECQSGNPTGEFQGNNIQNIFFVIMRTHFAEFPAFKVLH